MTQSPAEALLEPKLVGSLSGAFYVPAYQRGYRWGKQEVRKLLDDIWESRDRSYYLQPVVVKDLGEEWELIDGQQRLTTLFLIQQYMKNAGLKKDSAKYSIRYETRLASAEYLTSLDAERSNSNIDFFHMYEAYQCIHSWFEDPAKDSQYLADRFNIALHERVKVIWYEAAPDVDAVTLFTRLNVGRIPLTDAELTKALLLTEVGKQSNATDRALETALQWDSIERDLRAPELWAFITGQSEGVPTHISLLLDSLADTLSEEPQGPERPLFHTFETLRSWITESPSDFWEEVVTLHSLVKGWHENRDLFHKIGFLVAEGVTTLTALMEVAKERKKSEFEQKLDDLIRTHIDLTDSQLRDLNYGSRKSARLLFLMNVETIRQRENSTERYSFREQASGRWSLEHIHAQNAQELPRSAEIWRTWLKLHADALESLEDIEGKQELLGKVKEVLRSEQVSGRAFDALAPQLSRLLTSGDESPMDVDSISNLALLTSGDNSALSNSAFAVKRAEIIDRDKEGSYIPICTRNLFLKYYTPGSEHQMHFWSTRDRRYYMEEIVKTLVIAGYLLPDELNS